MGTNAHFRQKRFFFQKKFVRVLQFLKMPYIYVDNLISRVFYGECSGSKEGCETDGKTLAQ